METLPSTPYRSYKPRPFRRDERKDTTLIFGGLHWRTERLMQGVLERLGYRTLVLPTATKADLLTGREVADIGQCCPTSFTTGNVANFLRDAARNLGADTVSEKFVYVTAGACGSCRFGQYHQSYELALRNIGMERFRMFLLAQNKLDQGETAGGGLDLNPQLSLGLVWAIMVADVLQDLEYQTRPYEVETGATASAVKRAVELLYERFHTAPQHRHAWSAAAWYLTTNHYVRALREVKRLFEPIAVDRLRVKPIVKLTGEFYLQTVEGDPNYNIHRWLETEGAEVYPAFITIWLEYLLRVAAQRCEDRIGIERGARVKAGAIHALQRALRWAYNRLRAALAGVPRELPEQSELRALAAPYYHSRLTGGEGDMLIGKALWAYRHRKAHMTCELSPYSCMPNTMSIGAMAAVTGAHPDLLYAPLEIKGDAEVHALSRCQMILTEAKRRAQREYDDALQAAGVDTNEVRARAARRPDLMRALGRIPPYGATARSASLVRHLAAAAR